MAENSNKHSWLLSARSSNEKLQEHFLEPGKSSLGRDSSNRIVLGDVAVSNFHAEIQYNYDINRVVICDLESTNGTFVNGKRIYGSYELHHDDQIRIGHSLISVSYTFNRNSLKSSENHIPKKVTGELILESIDKFGVLIHEVGQRLVNIPDLNAALREIEQLIKRMIGAKNCQIVLASDFDNFIAYKIPEKTAQKIIVSQSATIFTSLDSDTPATKEPITQPVNSMMLVPVIIDQEVVALIFAAKSNGSINTFNNKDLQLVVAISNQVAMSIQRQRVEGKLLHNSSHDSLTDLPNRTLFLERLEQSLNRKKQEDGFEFAVLFFDIDDFKIVNDSLGHVSGDKLLIAIAERLKHNVRNIDTVARNPIVARFGGDEFAILLDDIKDNHIATVIANRLKDLLSRPFNIDGKKIFSTVSIGVAVSTTGYEKPEDILRDADMAMYHAKDLGKERVEVFDKIMHDRVSERMRMGNALRQGAIQNEFKLHYQPIISLHSGQIVGFEALVRWYTHDRGILNPGEFMDAIDTAGLIYSTDHWVLQTACQQLSEWQTKFPNNPHLFMSVNLSPKNIKHPNLAENIINLLQKTQLDPQDLWLEITEKVSAPDDDSAINVLKNLRSKGIRISLDDFGTGYSALNYLARFPIDALKVDRSFIDMIGKNDDSQKIIEMIRALASHLKLVMIAEGVEDQQQIPFLLSIECEYVQGFLYSKPMNAQTATELLANGKHWDI